MRKPEFESCFTFTGSVVKMRKAGKALHVLIHQDVAGKLPTDYRLVLPLRCIAQNFVIHEGDTVLVQDAIVYMKNEEVRLKVEDAAQIRLCGEPELLNLLAFSGKVIEVADNKTHRLIKMQQQVADRFNTILDVLLPASVSAEVNVGDVGYIRSAYLYEKDGLFRAKIENDRQYKCLYSPEHVMQLQTIEAKERFAL